MTGRLPEDLPALRRKSSGLKALADVRLATLGDGPGAGGRLLQARVPSGLALEIALDRGADLLRLSFRGHELGWHSAVEAPHPWPPAELEDGLGFGMLQAQEERTYRLGIEVAAL